MTTATNLLVAFVASLELAFQMFLMVLVLGAVMFILWLIYKSKGGKKTYNKYCCKVFYKLFNLINEGIERVFTI